MQKLIRSLLIAGLVAAGLVVAGAVISAVVMVDARGVQLNGQQACERCGAPIKKGFGGWCERCSNEFSQYGHD